MPNLRVERDGAFITLTIDRPEKLNALNAATLDELGEAVASLHGDRSVRGVCVTGAGEKAFVAGADIAELAKLDGLSARDNARRGQRVFRALELLPMPVIAAVNGFALGGGCELALACHVRLAAENAAFGLPEVGLGVIPGYGGTQRLSRLVGRGRATMLTLTAARIDAAEALRIGLVERVVPQAALLGAAHEMLTAFAKNGPVAVRAALEAIQRGAEMSLDDGLTLEANVFGFVFGTTDAREGLAAFLEKRRPEFQDR